MEAHKILQEHFERKTGAGYSLRALARDMGVSAPFLSNVLKGKKKLPVSKLDRLARLLDIDSENLVELRRQLVLKDSLHASVFKSPQAMSDWRVSGKTSLSALRQWFYVPLMELTLCDDYDGSVTYLARRLGIGLGAAEVALRELVSAGLMEVKNGRYVKVAARQRFASAQSRTEIRKLHLQMLKKAEGELANSTPEAFEKRLITGIAVTASPERIAIAKKMLNDALYEIANFLAEGEAKDIYQISAQFFSLTKK